MTLLPSVPRRGWVLYDGDCGVCAAWVPRCKDLLARRGLAIAPLQADWVVERLELPETELLQDIRLLLVDGRQEQGADVYRYVMRRTWWAMPFWLLSVLPGLSAVFDAAYRAFADNRHWISRTCRISAPDGHE
jgi:predicted DCC family thiol-disulfide oxidoreductase YuxK